MRKASISPTQELPQHPKSFPSGAPGASHPEGDDNEMSTEKHEFAAPHSSFEGEATRLEHERQLSISPAPQTERDQRIAQLTEDLALKSALLEQAESSEANAVEEKRRARLDLVDTKLKLKSTEAKLKNTVAKLDELLLSFDQHTGRLEEELANVHAKLEAKESELEAKESELEALRLRLAYTEKGLTKSKAETSRGADDATGSVNGDEDQVTRRLMERVRAIEAQMVSKRWNEKSIEDMECSNEKSMEEIEYNNEG